MNNSRNISNQSSIFSNFGWLSVSHGINLILPLIIYPYLIRIIGIESFGLVMFAHAMVMFFSNFMDYGFSLSGIRDVSVNRYSQKTLNHIFSSVLFTKLVLLLTGLLIFIIILLVTPKMSGNQFLFITSFSIVVGQWLLPYWFLQGLEKMKLVAILNISSKIMFLIMILLFVEESADYKYVNLWLGISQVTIGTTAIIFLIVQQGISVKWPYFESIIGQVKGNFLLFASNFSGYVSSNSTLVILGLIADPISIGYYAIVERILIILKAPAVLLYQTVFPRLCATAEHAISDLIAFSKQINKWVYMIFVPMTIITCVFAHEIILAFTGEALNQPIQLLYIISGVPLIVALNIPATQGLIAFKMDKSYSLITVSAAIFNTLLTIALTTYFNAYGAAVSILITEFCVTTMIYIIISRKLEDYKPLQVLNWV